MSANWLVGLGRKTAGDSLSLAGTRDAGERAATLEPLERRVLLTAFTGTTVGGGISVTSGASVAQTASPSALASTTTSLTTNRNPTVAGNSGGNVGSNTQYVTLVASVSAAGGTPTGTVQFQINGVNYGSPVALVNGVASSAPTTSLQNGASSITAIYSGNASYASSNATVTDTPFLGTPFVLPTSSQAAPTLIQAEDYDNGGQGISYNWFYGNVHIPGVYRSNYDVYTEPTTDTGGGYDVGYVYVPAWLNYSVYSPAAQTYQISFRVSSDGLGGLFHVNVDGVNVTGTMTIPTTNGWQNWITLTSPSFAMSAGNHILRLDFDQPRNGDVIGNFNWMQVSATSSGTALASTTTSVTSSQNPSTAGQPVTFTATVAPTTSGITPTGTVQWVVNNAPFGSPIALSGNQATLTTSNLAVGANQSVVAEYSGDTKYAGSTASVSQTVNSTTTNLATPSITVGSSGNPSAVGQAVSFSATVSGSVGTPTGTVQFQIDGNNFGTPVAVGANGVAVSTSTTTLTNGGHAVTALYSGNSSYNSGTATLTQTIGATGPGPTPFLGTPFVLPSVIQAEDFDNGGEGVGYQKVRILFPSPTPFRNSDVYIENSSDAGGGYDIGYIFAHEWLNYTVDSPTNATYTASFRVSSDGLGGTFHLEVDGVNVTGSIAVPTTGGWQNWITLTSQPFAVTAGTHSFKVVFDTPAPDGGLVCNFNYMQINASSGSALAATSTQVTSAQNPSTVGQPVTFTAIVTPTTSGVAPTGTVQWIVDNTPFGSPVALTGDQATLTTSSLSAGVNHTVVAQYSGDTNYSASSGSMNQTVTGGATGPTVQTMQIDAGGGAAGSYSADTDFNGGGTSDFGNVGVSTSSISALGLTPAPQSVYDTERYGNFTYTIPSLTPGGSYNVRLDFAELYFTSAGQRIFNVSINGNQVLSNFDIFAAAGGVDKAVAELFTATADAGGNVTIAFSSILNNAKVSAISITPTGAVPVTSAPEITANPSNQTVTAGQNASFTATASGTPTPTVQWQVSTDGGKTFTNIAGATLTTYSFTASAGQNGNEYQAVFTNGVGTPATTTAGTLTVNAGATGPAGPTVQIDAGGGAAGSYSADADFSGGSTSNFGNINVDTSALASQGLTPAPQSVYDTERYGNFTYTIPSLIPGASYSVRLDFAELYFTSAGQRIFNVAINGNQVLSNFDIIAAAGGAEKAIAEIFTATANTSGNITIAFTSIINNAKVSAITIAPTGAASASLPPAITTNPTSQTITAGQSVSFTATTGGSPAPTVQWRVSTDGGKTFSNIAGATSTTYSFTAAADQNGDEYQAVFTNGVGASATTTAATLTVNTVAATPVAQINAGGLAAGPYSADTDFSGGTAAKFTSAVVDTSAVSALGLPPAPQSVYQFERYGNFTYTIPNLTPGGTYSVRLDFAEVYLSSVGQRVFNVAINGNQVLSNFDIVAAAGGADKVIAEVFTATANSSGNIAIVFTSIVNNAKVSAITITPVGAA